ncbi:MAG: NapC/NirT family cytochrome c [Nitrosomonas sp.]|nr:NapC/NirT family cytochrome c [Nitrosomonas sp.]
MTVLQKGAIGTLLTGALLGIVLIGVVFGGEAALSTEEFCTSCHSMTYTGRIEGIDTHYGALGVNPGCRTVIYRRDSGISIWRYIRVVDGARELWLELVNDYSTLEKFNEQSLQSWRTMRRWVKKWDSVTCRDCHKNPDPPGEDAQAAQADGDAWSDVYRLSSESGA